MSLGDDGVVFRDIGTKSRWQQYPCIVAYNDNYALIANSKEDGILVDKEGKTISTGNPLDIGQSGLNLHGVGFTATMKSDFDYKINKIWKEKYPEYLKGQIDEKLSNNQ